MKAVVAREILRDAYARVTRKKGAAGVDEMTVEELKPYLQEYWTQIKEDVLNGTYQPQAVRCVEIPKPSGGCDNRPFRRYWIGSFSRRFIKC